MPEGRYLQVAPHHIQIYEKLSRSHRAICLLPRDSGKSTLGGILYPLWVLGKSRSKSFLLISHSQSYAETFLQEVQRIMELDQYYIDIFGQLKPKQKSRWTDNEIIVEGAARRKEASFAVMGWGAHLIGRHPDYIVCYSDDTEVLTVEGWKFFRNVTMKDDFYTLNMVTEEIEVQKPNSIIRQQYHGYMTELDSSSVNLYVTPEHNLLTRRNDFCDRLHRRTPNPWALIPAKSIFGKTGYQFKKNGVWKGKDTPLHIIPAFTSRWVGANNGKHRRTFPEVAVPMEDWVRFLGIYLAEGCVSSRYGKHANIVRIGQKTKIEQVRALLRDLPFRIIERPLSCGGVEFVIHSTQLAEHLKPLGKALHKHIPSEVKLLDKKYLQLLFDAMMIGDGTGDRTYYTSSKRLADDVQEIVLKLGLAANISEKPTETPTGKILINPSYSVHIYSFGRCEPRFDNKDVWKETKYDNSVYCVTVPNHTLYVRRNGKAVWCGNCDDVIDRQVAESQVLMENLKEWYRKELVPCLTLRSRLIILGTRWRWDDLYGDILEDPHLGEGFEKLVVQAILPNGESYWPERWPLERLLERKKEVGLHAWMSQYMNDPSLEEAQEFKKEWIQKYKPPIDKSKMTIYQAVDPAISEKDTAAFFAHVTVGVQDEHVYLLNLLRTHINPAQQVSTIRNLAASWMPQQIFIEDVAYQNALIRALPELPVKGVKQSRDKIMRIRGLSPFFEAGRIHIDEAHEDFEKELMQFPRSGTYDLLDAFEMIIREVFAPSARRTGYSRVS